VERLERLAHTLDHIRERYGFGAILRGKSWESQQTLQSATRDDRLPPVGGAERE
jgi:hypothetical protein